MKRRSLLQRSESVPPLAPLLADMLEAASAKATTRTLRTVRPDQPGRLLPRSETD